MTKKAKSSKWGAKNLWAKDAAMAIWLDADIGMPSAGPKGDALRDHWAEMILERAARAGWSPRWGKK